MTYHQTNAVINCENIPLCSQIINIIIISTTIIIIIIIIMLLQPLPFNVFLVKMQFVNLQISLGTQV
jgi:hypothetical protein